MAQLLPISIWGDAQASYTPRSELRTIETEFRFTEFSLAPSQHLRKQTFFRLLNEFRLSHRSLQTYNVDDSIKLRTNTGRSITIRRSCTTQMGLPSSVPEEARTTDIVISKQPLPWAMIGNRAQIHYDNSSYSYRLAINEEVVRTLNQEFVIDNLIITPVLGGVTVQEIYNLEVRGEPRFVQYETNRVKKRTSFIIQESPLIQLDLTEVTMSVSPGDPEHPAQCNTKGQATLGSSVGSTTYEIELEVYRTPDLPLNLIRDHLQKIISRIQATYLMYSTDEYRKLVRHYNETLYFKEMGSPLRSRDRDGRIRVFDHRGTFQARNLHFPDLVYGGIVGNDVNSYRVTLKVDGVRKFLVFYGREVWLVHAPGEANKVIDSLPDTSLHGYIFEGELVPKDKRRYPVGTDPSNPKWTLLGTQTNDPVPRNPYWFLIFDVIARPPFGNFSAGNLPLGEKSIQLLPHFVSQNELTESVGSNRSTRSRMAHAERLVRLQWVQSYFKSEDSPLYLNTKKFRGFRSAADFFNVMSRIESERGSGAAPYEDDGYIFMPTRMPYTQWLKYRQPRPKIKLNKRVLTVHPDICKWKPVEMMTIDFEVDWKINQSSLLTSNRGGLAAVSIRYDVELKTLQGIFTGTSRQRYRDQVDIDSLLRLNPDRVDGLVVEFKWDSDTNKFVAIRIREDKPRPNSSEVASDNWNWIFDPISTTTLTGYDTRLLRKYHNRIKRRLHGRPIPPYLFLERSRKQSIPNYTLLDLGSGGGGDLSSWQRSGFERVLAVEPNSTNIKELYRRAVAMYPEKTISIVNRYDSLEIRIAKFSLARERNDPILILQTVAQDYEFISEAGTHYLGGPSSVCSLMLSMSFLWQSSEIVRATLETISRNLSINGELRFFTIDGNLVEQAFKPTFNGAPLGNPMGLGPVTLEYFPNGKPGLNEPASLDINIPGSILGGTQHEWLVRIQDFISGLAPYGFKLQNHLIADSEGFLPEPSRILSSLYSYGWFGQTHPDTSPSLPLSSRAPQPALPPIPTGSMLLQALESKDQTEALVQVLGSPESITVTPKNEYSVLPSVPWIPPSPIEDNSVYRTVITPHLDSSEIMKSSVESKPPSRMRPRRRYRAKPLQQVVHPGLVKSEALTSSMASGPQLSVATRPLPEYPSDNEFFRFQERITMEVPGLPYLAVGAEGQGDDTLAPVIIKWYTRDPAYRVSCIGDASCFFHSVLKATSPQYVTPQTVSRRQQARELRNELANLLEKPNPNDPGERSYWESVAGGAYPEYQQLKIQDVDSIDYSLPVLQQLLRSDEYIGDELYQYVSEVLGVNIHVMFGASGPEGLLPYHSTKYRYSDNIFIVAVGSPGAGRHYELLTIYQNSDMRPLSSVPEAERTPVTSTQFKTLHPLVIAFRSLQLYRAIFAALKTIYRQYSIAIQAGIDDDKLYSDLDEMIRSGKQIYTDAYNNMLKASSGDTSTDIVSTMNEHLKSMQVLERRAVSMVAALRQ